MKIMILAPANSTHTVRWVNSLASLGHAVHLVSLPNHKPKENKVDDRVTVHLLNHPGALGYFVNARQVVKIYKLISPDIVNAHYASGYGTLVRYSKIRPVLLSVWGSDVYDYPFKNYLNMRIIKRNLLYADRIASTSNCMAKQVERLIGPCDIFITPFGVELEKFKLKQTKNLQDSKDRIVIGNIKTLKPIYGIDILIKATRELIDKLNRNNLESVARRITVQIYGEGPQRSELESLIKALHLESIVKLMGVIPNNQVPDKLTEFDIFCITSIAESFGVAVVEAMAAALPVVATNAEGFNEVMTDGTTGIIIEDNSPSMIADTLYELILDDKKRDAYGKSGRERAQALYSWDDNVNTMLDAYLTTTTTRHR